MPRLTTPIRFQLRGPQLDGEFRQSTIAEVSNRAIHLSTSIEPILHRERPHTFTVTVNDLDGWQIDLQVPPGCQALPQLAPVNSKEWIVEVPKHDGDMQPLRLQLQRPLENKRELLLPAVSIRAGELPGKVEQRLLLLGREMRALEMIGLHRVAEPLATALAPWPKERERWQTRGGTLWQAAESEVRARIVASPNFLEAAPSVRIALADTEASQLADRWLYRTTFDLLHESGASLQCRLPADAQLEGIAFEGDILPLPANQDGIPIPLPLDGGARLLQIVWSARQPRWEIPPLESGGQQLTPVETLWTGNTQASQRIETEGMLSAAALYLKRADALLKLSAENPAYFVRGSFGNERGYFGTEPRLLG